MAPINLCQICQKILKALGHAFAGLKIAIKFEFAFRVELFIAIPLIVSAPFLARDKLSLALMLGSIFLMLITELINTSIEAALDRVGKEHHDLTKIAKDIACAAVFLSIANLFVTWGILLLF